MKLNRFSTELLRYLELSDGSLVFKSTLGGFKV